MAECSAEERKVLDALAKQTRGYWDAKSGRRYWLEFSCQDDGRTFVDALLSLSRGAAGSEDEKERGT